VSLLLDTHALLWWWQDEPISDEAAARIADPDVLVAVSAASIWEIAIKRELGKIRFEGPLAAEVHASGFEPLPVVADHAEAAGRLPSLHRDPFDRMLVAQAQVEGLTIVSRDRQLAAYDVDVLAC
jgi:PIN domain nuclease of toxin-antitoxin system